MPIWGPRVVITTRGPHIGTALQAMPICGPRVVQTTVGHGSVFLNKITHETFWTQLNPLKPSPDLIGHQGVVSLCQNCIAETCKHETAIVNHNR